MGKEAHNAEVRDLSPVFEKLGVELKHKQNLLKYKSTIHIPTFNVGTLNRIGQLLELIAGVVEHSIDIVYVQKQRYHHREEEIEYHDRHRHLSQHDKLTR